MDIISFNEAATANSRIEKINANPDSTSGIVTVPKVIASGETITIPAGRVAILPNVQIGGVLNVEGEVFIPSGATLGGVVEKVTSTDNAIVRFDGTTGAVQNSVVTIGASGEISTPGEISTSTQLVIGSGGDNRRGAIYSDDNWGMLFRAKIDTPILAPFVWMKGDGGELFRHNGTALTTNITGNAATATKLQTARTINEVAFDGSANITVADSTKVALAAFTGANVNLAANGYQKLPSGLIIQWGLITSNNIGAGSTAYVNYNIAFTSGVAYTGIHVQGVTVNNAISVPFIILPGDATALTRFQIFNTDVDSALSIYRWFSIGY